MTEDSNVTPFPEPLDRIGARIDSAVRRASQGHQEWIEGTIDLAMALAEGRERFPSDQKFGQWLAGGSHDHVGYQDRAALLNMAKDKNLMRIVLEETSRKSYRLIWSEEMSPRFFDSDVKEEILPSQPANTANTADTPLETPPTPISAPSQPDDSEPDTESGVGLDVERAIDVVEPPQTYVIRGMSGKPVKDNSKAKLISTLGASIEDYTLLVSAYPSERQTCLKSTLATLPKRKAKALFDLAVGVVRSRQHPRLTNARAIDVRMFFPHLPEAFAKFITITAAANKTALLTRINEKSRILKEDGMSPTHIRSEIDYLWQYELDRPRQEPAAPILATEDTKNRIGHTVTFCGEPIWPNPHLQDVTYDDMNAGFHLVQNWVQTLGRMEKPKEVTTMMLHLLDDIRKATTKEGLITVMTSCISAYSRTNGSKQVADMSNCVAPGLADG